MRSVSLSSYTCLVLFAALGPRQELLLSWDCESRCGETKTWLTWSCVGVLARCKRLGIALRVQNRCDTGSASARGWTLELPRLFLAASDSLLWTSVPKWVQRVSDVCSCPLVFWRSLCVHSRWQFSSLWSPLSSRLCCRQVHFMVGESSGDSTNAIL